MARKARGFRVRLGTIRVTPATATILEAHRLQNKYTSLGDVLDELAALRFDRDATLQASKEVAEQAEKDRLDAVAMAHEWERKFREAEDKLRAAQLATNRSFESQSSVPRVRKKKARHPTPPSQTVIDAEPEEVRQLLRRCFSDRHAYEKVVDGLLRGGYRGPTVLDALRVSSAERILRLLGVTDGSSIE